MGESKGVATVYAIAVITGAILACKRAPTRQVVDELRLEVRGRCNWQPWL